MLKRVIKVSSYIIFVFTILFISINSVYAVSSDTKNVSERISTMTVEDLQLSNISFKNLSNTRTKTFGLEGTVYNSSFFEYSFNVTVTYYDLNNTIIATASKSQIIPAGEYDSVVQMLDLSEIKSGYTVNDIVYYKLDVSVISGNEVSKSITNKIGNGEYAITKYSIIMKVNENNTFDMDENIVAYFKVAKHGIFRSLPLKNVINRADGTTSSNKAKITDVKVNNKFTTYRENGNYIIKIGDENTTLTGDMPYNIQYNYNIGKDPSKDYDELYFNLIGTEWDTTISNFTFRIEMPKEFEKSKLGFSIGNKGSSDSNYIKYSVNGNVITGSCSKVINPGESLTVRIQLPEGYFVGASNSSVGNFTYLMFIVPIIFALISFLIWKRYGKDDQVIETVEFYPPEGFNSLEIGYLYKGEANNQDVISLLVYLANKGYIKISEIDEKTLFSSKKGFKINKIKNYDGNNVNEKLFLNGLFKKKMPLLDIISAIKKQDTLETVEEPQDGDLTEVTSIDLYDNFYGTIARILENINNKENKNKIFEKSASGKSVFIKSMITIAYCTITIIPILEYGMAATAVLPFALLFPGLGFITMFIMVSGGAKTIYVNGKATNSYIGTKLFGLFFGIMFGGIPWLFLVLPTLLEEKIYPLGYITGLICLIVMAFCLKFLPKRTPYGNQVLGKILGFKNFLETAEKQKLEALVMENPQYFYNILPYTYVLGVSDKWIKKFEEIALQAPNWYDSSSAFSAASFGTFMSNTMTSASSVMSSSSSSGSGGGGSSGGGSGGGGGGSW